MRKHAIAAVAILLLTLPLLSVTALGQKKPAKQAPPEPKYKVGEVAPDFTLKDQNGKDVSLHDFRGKKSVALAFYVFAFTGG
jgi:cytochrome oxidase Cu insertion factor (SCO1/SenC/PrrC family)